MATDMNTSLHGRSNSVPSAPHPFISQYDEHLNRLKASEATSSFTICSKLNGLHALHECTDMILQLASTQQALSRESCKTWVDELLEGSLRLLDICGIAKDVLLQSTESINGLQLTVRRWCETAFKIEGGKYLSSRKKAKKTIQKALENIKGFKKGMISTTSNADDETRSMIKNLKEAEAVTLIQLETLLSFISGSRGKNKWSIISKLRQPKRVSCDSDQSNTNEFEVLDKALQLVFHKTCNNMNVESFQLHMGNLELCIQGLDAGIQHLERQLIRTRVSLLNIYNH
ncbi:hypothetical protein RJT34_31884 [Clitoria ternatea]|uniref:DUF241 domain protein n=1 Tax=Clitoria ternatea TaxID=43366 RepID=A0AAN9I383_CLITE